MTLPDTGRICWVITGAGHFLAESVDIVLSAGEMPLAPAVDVYLTRAAKEVAHRYAQTARLEAGGRKIFYETDYSAAPLIYFASGRYAALVIAPATSNTVAKCVLGIADSLASNFFAQAGKSRVPIYILPTDVAPEMTSVTPSGRRVAVAPREIDLRCTDMLASFRGVTLLRSPAELELVAGRMFSVTRSSFR